MVFILLVLAAGESGAQAGDSPGRKITVNQLGYYTHQPKIAMITGGRGSFSLFSIDEQKIVRQGQASSPKHWPFSGESVRIADFSTVDIPGRYKVIDGGIESFSFTIGGRAYRDLSVAALRKFYLARASTELPELYAGKWRRPGGHPDTTVYVHMSAADERRPAGTVISSPKGWYDAGDYNKYVVNSGITTYTLLLLYEMFPGYCKNLHPGIPRTHAGLPELLEEILWNLEWMLSMQDTNDGGVYHKLTSKKFSPFIMPHEDLSERFVVMKTTNAALDFAGVMAQASRVYRELLPRFSEECLRAAVRAWDWAARHPRTAYTAPPDIKTGPYRTKSLEDECQWAAIELHITTGDSSYMRGVDLEKLRCQVPAWGEVGTLGVMSLLVHRREATRYAGLFRRYREFTDTLYRELQASAYKTCNKDFRWGSNADFLNQSMVFIVAHHAFADTRYLDAAAMNADYVFGRNPLNMCFVTGFGAKSPQNIHDRISVADNIPEPIPGMVVGGANPENVTDCGKGQYPSLLPALCYLDGVCSYSTNEVAINWNAPLLFVASALDFLFGEGGAVDSRPRQ
jgi:endoglucanase